MGLRDSRAPILEGLAATGVGVDVWPRACMVVSLSIRAIPSLGFGVFRFRFFVLLFFNSFFFFYHSLKMDIQCRVRLIPWEPYLRPDTGTDQSSPYRVPSVP